MFLKKALRLVDRLGVRAQLVLLFVSVFGVLFAAFSASVFIYIAQTHQREFDSALYNYVIDVSHSVDLSSLDTKTPVTALEDTEMILPFSLGETLLQIEDTRGRTLLRSKSLGNGQLPFSLHQKPRLAQERALFETVNLPGGRYRMVSHLAYREDVGSFVVQAAVPNLLLDREQESLIAFFSVTVPLILFVAAIFGLGFSGRAMAPVSAIISKANEIEARHLSEAIPVPASNDEIRELAVTLNRLLKRLEKAFRTQEGFVADASHQLKTPLAILKGELELFKKGSRSAEEIEAFVASAAQEIDSLSKMVADLLMLASMDAAGGQPSLQSVQLDEKLIDSVSRFERVAKPRGIRFSVNLEMLPPDSVGGSFTMQAEPELLRSMIDNLLDNALKYSPDGAAVQVTLFDRGAHLVLMIEDSGPGIPPAVLEKLFARFYRSESSRDVISGSGLGLSIVRRIAELHRGTVEASNRVNGGACFEVVLPRDPQLIKNV
jgi:signal transduction histidine kinase